MNEARVLRTEIDRVEQRLGQVDAIILRESGTMTGSRGTSILRPEVREQIRLRDHLYKLIGELRRIESAAQLRAHKSKHRTLLPTLEEFIALSEEELFALPAEHRAQLRQELRAKQSAELRQLLCSGEIHDFHLPASRLMGGNDPIIGNPRLVRRRRPLTL